MTSRLCVILNGAYAADIEHRARRPTLTYRPDYLASAAVPLAGRGQRRSREELQLEFRRSRRHASRAAYDSSRWLPFRRGMAIRDIPLAMRMGRGSLISECDTPDGLPPIGFDWGRVEEHIVEIDMRADLSGRLAEQTQQKIAARQK